MMEIHYLENRKAILSWNEKEKKNLHGKNSSKGKLAILSEQILN